MADRSKYQKASSEEMMQKTEEMSALSSNENRGVFLKVEPGINKFRIFPAPIKAHSSLFWFPKVTSFLPLMVDEYDDNGNKTGKQVEKRKAVFNAKVHGGLDIDIVEAYIEAAKEKFSATIKDKKELLEKLKPLTDWKVGIKPTSSWICYAIKYNSKGKAYGRLQLSNGVKQQLDTLCLREGDSGTPITIDLFSDVDTGKPFQWTSDPNNSDAKQKNKVNILFEEDMPLTDEELDMLEGWDSLEDIYTNSYTKTDFKKQLEGLQLFDKKNKLNIFETPSFQSIIQTAKEEVEEKLGNDDADKEEKKQTAGTGASAASSEESTIPEILQDMDKKTLMTIPEILELKGVEIKVTTPPSKMRQMIKDAIVQEYELEGDDETINSSITDILANALESAGESGDEGDGAQNPEPEPEPETKEEAAPKKGSLLDKYRSKKS